MTKAEIRARALAQAGEQENALGELTEALSQYMEEGRQALCPEGWPDTRLVQVTGGRGNLDGDVIALISVRDALGREKSVYRVENGVLAVTPDGLYTLRVMALPSGEGDEVGLPEAFHGALADYMTWRLLGNGGRAQQVRAEFYRQSWMRAAVDLARRAEAMLGPRRRINRYA